MRLILKIIIIFLMSCISIKLAEFNVSIKFIFICGFITGAVSLWFLVSEIYKVVYEFNFGDDTNEDNKKNNKKGDIDN